YTTGVPVNAPHATDATIISITLPPGFSQKATLNGTFAVTLSDHAALATRTLETLATNFGTYSGVSPPSPGSIHTTVGGFSAIDMDMNADSGSSIPFDTIKISSELLATYTFNNETVYPTPPPSTLIGSLPYVEFRNVTVDLGSIIGTAGDILQ